MSHLPATQPVNNGINYFSIQFRSQVCINRNGIVSLIWCILTTSRNDSILADAGIISAFWWPQISWIGVSRHFKRNAWMEWPEMWHADVSDHLQKLIDFGQYWPNLGPVLARKLGELRILWHSKEMQGRNGLKCGMLMYCDFGLYWPGFGPLVAKIPCVIRVSEHSEDNTWRKWPEIWHASPHSPPPTPTPQKTKKQQILIKLGFPVF